MQFWYLLDGKNIGDVPDMTDDHGSKVLKVPFSRKARRASFTLVGSQTRASKPLYIPPGKNLLPKPRPGETVRQLLKRLEAWEQREGSEQ